MVINPCKDCLIVIALALLPVRNMRNGERNMTQKRSGYKIISIASLLLITSHSCAIQNLIENANSILIVKFREDVRRE